MTVQISRPIMAPTPRFGSTTVVTSPPKVFSPSILENTSKDDIKFHAAARRQIPILNAKCIEKEPQVPQQVTKGGSRLLVASPYTDENHLLDLNSLDAPHALLAEALTGMTNVTDDYAVAPYPVAFNWDRILADLRLLVSAWNNDRPSDVTSPWIFPKTEFYVIVFRSQLPLGLDRSHLFALDKEAHREAVQAGQLLKYWYGTPDVKTGRNLATCIWRNRGDAKLGGGGPVS